MNASGAFRPAPRAAALAVLCAALAATACETPRPTPLEPSTTAYRAPDAPATARTDRAAVREAVERHFPSVLTEGLAGKEVLVFVVDAEGEVVQTHAGGSAAPAAGVNADRLRVAMSGLDVDPSTVGTVEVWKLAAGQMGPDPVGIVWMQLKRADGTVVARAPAGEGVRLRVQSAGEGKHVVVEKAGEGSRITVRGAQASGSVSDVRWVVFDSEGTELARGEGDFPGVMNARLEPDAIRTIEVLKGKALPDGKSEIRVYLKEGATLPPAGAGR